MPVQRSAYLLIVPSSALKCVSPMHCATSSTHPTALVILFSHRSSALTMALTRSGGRIVGSKIRSVIVLGWRELVWQERERRGD